MWLSSGPLRSGDLDRDLFGDGIAVVRRCDRAVDKSRQFIEARVRMRGPGRKAPIPRSSRTASNAHPDLPHDRLFGAFDADAQAHTDAGALRRISLHGRSVTQRPPILRQNTHHANARQVSAGLHVPSAGKNPPKLESELDLPIPARFSDVNLIYQIEID